jgi:hypothetical protein
MLEKCGADPEVCSGASGISIRNTDTPPKGGVFWRTE